MALDTSPSSPHFRGVQPSWRDLNFTTELLHYIWVSSKDMEYIQKQLGPKVGKSKLENSIRFLRRCGLLADDDELTLTGIWLADEFRPATTTIRSDQTLLNEKSRLSDAEITILREVLFRKNTVPMIATIHQLATTEVSDKETKERAEGFLSRTSYLNEYSSSWSIGTKKKKAQAHFEWVKQLDLATRTRDDHIELTPTGKTVHQRLKDSYPSDWPQNITDY